VRILRNVVASWTMRSNDRATFRGSTGRPVLVVNTKALVTVVL
jgi:hypothetical protein